jgi:gas vesicle protein
LQIQAKQMKPNSVIYYIKQSKEFTEIWSNFSREEKERVLQKMESADASDIEKVLLEVKTGQNRLF